MSSPAKQRQIARILRLLEALKVGNTVRTVDRVTRPVTEAPITPALQLVVGPEDARDEEEDTQGFLLEYVVAITLIVSNPKDAERLALVDTITAAIQVAIESDIQLAQLVRFIRYQGDDPFYSVDKNPIAGNTLSYLVQYRRRRAKPSEIY